MDDSNACQSAPGVGCFGWNELVTQDMESSGTFYTQLFGWTAETLPGEGRPADAPPYTLFKLNNRGMIGGMVNPGKGVPSQWVPYVVVDNVAASFEKSLQLGAEVILPVLDIGEIGQIAVLRDPQGAVIGLHEMRK